MRNGNFPTIIRISVVNLILWQSCHCDFLLDVLMHILLQHVVLLGQNVRLAGKLFQLVLQMVVFLQDKVIG